MESKKPDTHHNDHHNDEETFLDSVEFNPPKLPLRWLATTFIAPVLVIVLPQLFDASKDSMQTLVIFALALFSVLSFVLFLITFFRLYNESFAYQIIQLRQRSMSERMNTLDKRIEENDATLRAVMETILRMLDKQLKEYDEQNPKNS